MKKMISIVIPCFNCSDTIMKTWDSLKKQTTGIDNLECIFVDDASSDDGQTWMTLEQIESDCPESVMIIHLEENMRQGGARNVGISYAAGEYLMFLDSDDEYVDNACEIAFESIKNSDSDVVQFNHIYRLGDLTRITNESDSNGVYRISCHEDRIKFLNSSLVTYGCTNKIYRLELIRQAEAVFAEKAVYEEPLFVYPCFLYADKVSLITDALYIYNMHEGSTITSAIGNRLYDHPRVQLELLEYCMRRTELFNEYRDVIGLYFLWSYYLETICFASENKGAFLSLEYYVGMQKVCRAFFPDWQSNPLIKQVPDNVFCAFENIDKDLESQEELNRLIIRISYSMR